MASSQDSPDFGVENKRNSRAANSRSDRGAEEGRHYDRPLSVFLPALFEIVDFTGFCLVRNLSAKGMMAVVYAHFAPDQRATVQFSDDFAASGRIIWSEAERVGIEFASEIDVDALLGERITWLNARKVERAPHLAIDCDGEVIVDDRLVPVRIADISQYGVRLKGVHAQPGEEIMVVLPGMKPRKTLVNWTDGGTLGLKVLIPFGLRELAQWVVERHSLQRRAV